jgi:putative ATP-dependent endonuclease of OLD family
MYISKVHIENYRCFSSCTVNLNPKLTVLVGENNIGKTNFLAALALIFSSDNSSRQLQAEDIWDGWRSLGVLPVVRIQVVLEGFENDVEKALVQKWLINSPQTLKARINYEFRPLSTPQQLPDQLPINDYEWVLYGGELERERIDFRDLIQIRLELLHALRDAERELSTGGRKRLGKLVERYKPDGFDDENNPLKQKVERTAQLLNLRFQRTQPITDVQDQLNQRLESVSGPTNRQDAQIIPADIGFDDLVRNIRLNVGLPGRQVRPVEFNGLGYNNLLFISVLLSEFYKRRQLKQGGITLPIVAIEEPEAHLHPHLQRFLNRYFVNNEDGQVIVTSHSTHITSSVNPEYLVAMYQDSDGLVTATSVKDIFGQDAVSRRNLNTLQRHLDATKSTLFFARSLILVEGLAESILIPILAKKCFGVDLDDKGVSVVAVHGTAFAPFIQLFGPDAIKKTCAIITDSDPPQSVHPDQPYTAGEDYFPLNVEDADFRPAQGVINLAENLDAQKAGYVKVFNSLKTFEHDFIVQNQRTLIEDALDLAVQMSTKITSPMINRAKEQVDLKSFSKLVLFAIRDGKGSFAQALAEKITNDQRVVSTPAYITDAFRFLGLIA